MLLLILAILFLVASILALIIALFWFSLLLIYKAPYVKTPAQAIASVLNNVIIKPEHLVYDLGCGDAEVLIAAEKKFECKTIGYEASPFPYVRARRNVRRQQSKTEVYWRDFFKADLRKADVVFCFLIESLMLRVGVYLREQLRPGTRVICYGYPIPDWQPAQTIDVSGTTSKIYIYNIA